MKSSPLVEYQKLSPNHSGKRTHEIDTITPHCVVGQLTVESIGNIFSKASAKASSNYGIGKDGKIGLFVVEGNRSWCSSNRDNDQRAVTIECASDIDAPYAMSDKVYNRLIDLCVDICARYNKTKLIWLGDKTKTMLYQEHQKQGEMVLTVHRWFANKSCPGDWLYSRLGDLAKTVTDRLSEDQPATEVDDFTPYQVRINITNLRIRSGPGTNHENKGHIMPGVYTIVAESTGEGAPLWGKLKSGAGWVALEYTTKI